MVKALGVKMVRFKKVNVDFWGLILVAFLKTNRKSRRRALKFFYKRVRDRRRDRRRRFVRYVYRLDVVNIPEPRRRLKKRFTSLRLVKYFYITLVYKQFRRMARAAHKKDGYFEGHYCLALEGRVVTFLYRTGFVATMQEAFTAVRQGAVTLNGRVRRFANAQVALYRLLGIHAQLKKRVYFDLLVRLCVNRRSLFNRPRYMYISHWFLFAFMQQHPMLKDLVLPKFLDIYRATGYAH